MATSAINNAIEPDFVTAESILEKLYAVLRYRDSRFSLVESIKELEELFSRGSEVVRYKILTELIYMECKQGIPLLVIALQDDTSALVRHEGAFGLGILGNQSHCETLINTLNNDESPMVRHEAAIALAETGGENQLDTLYKITEDGNPEVAASAKFAIQNIQMKNM